MKRRLFLKQTSIAVAATLTGCGGSADSQTPVTPAPPSLPPTPVPVPPPSAPSPTPPPPPPPPPLGPGLSTLSLHPTQTGTLPYLATVFPMEGAVPNGQSIQSPDDPALRASVLSRWPDGSASVAVLAGETAVTAGTTTFIRLQAGAVVGTALTPARVGQLVTNITVDCGALGSAVINNFSSPARTWWANERVICCRYRAPVGADPTLEAVIDVHAFASSRAFVEVVVENCKVNSASPAAPAAKNYSASVVVNGSTIATVSSSAGPGGTHQAFRAWYASTWAGGDPGVEVTHDTASMQAHPMMQKIWKSTDQNLQAIYQGDIYEPWSTERLNVPNMGGTGDHPAIGSFTQWDTRYLQAGDKYVRRSVIANALAALTCNINWRDTATGLVPTFTEIGNKEFQHGTWPGIGSEPAWEHAHSPAVGLMAFMCRPSPCFIEVAQKAAVWQHCWRNFQDSYPYIGNGYQTRGKGWTIRAINHAIFVTPDALPWKAAAQTVMDLCLNTIEAFKNLAANQLGFVWNFTPGAVGEDWGGDPGFQFAMFMHHYLLVEIHKVAATKALPQASQSRANAIADWACAQPVRWINESAAGEWRAADTYSYTVATSEVGQPMVTFPTWAQIHAWHFHDAPPAASGPWLTMGATWASSVNDGNTAASPLYDAYYLAALVCAVERGISGADQAWQKFYGTNPTTSAPNGNLTNLAAWAVGGATEPRWCWLPRNK